MVVLNLKLKVISENAKEISIDEENYNWCFKIECLHCHIEQPNEIYFSSNDEVEMQKGHGTANFIMKCKECKKIMTLGINNRSNKNPFVLNIENGNDEGIICGFECRGCKITEWTPKEGINIEAYETEKIFEDVDITNEWCDYDENSQKTVSLLEPVTWRFEED